MRNIYTLFFTIITNIIVSQTTQTTSSQITYSLDNNVGFNLTQANNIERIRLNYNGDNSLSLKYLDIDMNTNYVYILKLQNEFNNKINFSKRYTSGSYESSVFTTYQYNSSYIRKIESDHWIGAGYGLKRFFKGGSGSLSYAAIYQNTTYANGRTSEQMRHSVRGKIRYKNSKIGLQSEYYYQPSYESFDDYIIYGTTKLTLSPDNKFSFNITDFVNYNSTTKVRILHNLTFGVGVRLGDKKKVKR